MRPSLLFPSIADCRSFGLLKLLFLHSSGYKYLVYLSSETDIRMSTSCRETHLLSSECECSGGDARREAETFDDLLPLLLVDHLHQTPTGYHQVEQLVQVEHLFRHDWKPVDRSSWGDSI